MQARLALFFITLLAFALFAAASPAPYPPHPSKGYTKRDANANELQKKQLKQYNARRGVEKRDDDHYKPSKCVFVSYPRFAATAL